MSADKYINRTIDILAFQGTPVIGKPTLLVQTLASDGESGLIITGIRKLAQRFLFELLLERGSLVYQPNRGSTFMAAARAGTFRTTTDVLAAFSAALPEITDNLIQEEFESDPDDEKFESAEVTSVTLANSRVSIVIRVDSVAGESREVIAAIPTMV